MVKLKMQIGGILSAFLLFQISSAGAVTITSIVPNSGGNNAVVNVTVNGSGFLSGASLKLTQVVASPGTWSSSSSLNSIHLFKFGMVRLHNGKVLVAGGRGNSSPTAAAELYDPALGTWVVTGSLSTPRDQYTLTLLSDGKVLAVGGQNQSSTRLSSVEIYDPASGTWFPTGSMSIARNSHTATLLPNGKVLVAGGSSIVGGFPVAVDSAEIYDPMSGTWSPTGSMTTPHVRAEAILLNNGKVLVAGGSNTSFSAFAELFDPTSGTWSATGSLNTARHRHTMTLLADGRVLVAGGNNGLFLNSSELYDPIAGTWGITGSLNSARQQAAAVKISDGKVLVIGGSDSTGDGVTTTELYDPSIGTWVIAAPFSNARLGNEAALLLDGRILAVGGFNSSFTTTVAAIYNSPSAEILATGVNVLGSTQLTGILDLTGQPAGLWDVTITNPDSQSATLNGAFTIFNVVPTPDPVVLSIAPNTGANNNSGLNVAVAGSNFLGGSILRLTRTAHADIVASNVNAVNSSLINGTFDLSGQAIGIWNVVVSTNGSSGTLNNGFTINNPPPTISSINPNTGIDNGAFNLSVNGTGFLTGASLRLFQQSDSTGTWSNTGSPLNTRFFKYRTVRLNNGTVLVAGGSQNIGATATAELYNPDLGTWAVTGSLGTPRDQYTLTLLSDGRVLAVGGVDQNEQPLSSTEVYDPISGIWTPTGSMSIVRVGHTSTLLSDGKVLVAGGSSNVGGFYLPVNSAEIFDPMSGTWSLIGSMPTPHSRAEAVLLNNGKVLVAGGSTNVDFSAAAELFDPVAGTWSATGSLITKRHRHAMTLLTDGRVLVAGGENGLGINSAELYDPVSGIWSPTGSIFAARQEAAAVRMLGGKVLMVGGTGHPLGNRVTAVEIYDPANGTWSLTSPLSIASLGNTATLLFDGRILAFGLDDAEVAPRAALFAPPSSTVIGTNVSVLGPTQITGTLDMTGQATGAWDVVVINPDGQTTMLNGGFILSGYAASTVTLGGQPVLELVSSLSGMNITAVSTMAPIFSLALGTATAQGLNLVSNIFDINPSTSFNPAASITFRFDPSVVVDTSTLAIYRFDGIAWGSVTVANQMVFLGADARITATISHTSLWALFTTQMPDTTAPSLSLFPVHGSTETTALPTIIASYSDNGRGIDQSSLQLFLDGLNVTAQSNVTSVSATFNPSAALSQGTHTIFAVVADLTGNSSSATAAFFLDSLAPNTSLLVNGLAVSATSLVLVSTDSLGFSATDAGTGVLETRYSVDGATETIFVSTFSLTVGTHTLAYRSLDRVNNTEGAHNVFVDVRASQIDGVAPLVRLDFPGSGALGVEQAVGGVVNVRGEVSDANALTWKLEAAPGIAATSGFVQLTAGAGDISGLLAAWNTASFPGYRTLRLSALDVFGNPASITATVFVGNPVFNLSIGRKNSDHIISSLKNPTGIAIRSDGLIWVAGTENDRLLLLTSTGSVLKSVGADGQEPLHFQNPQGLALDQAGNLYVADKGRDRIVKLSPNGSTVLLDISKKNNQGRPVAGTGPGQFKKPWDVAVDANGDIYAADSGNNRIQVFNASGIFLRQFGQSVFPHNSDVHGITLTPDGIWASDKESERIYLFSRSGGLIKSIGDSDSVVGEISRTRGLASDRLGALYVVEPNRDRTQKFDPAGKGLISFGTRQQVTHSQKAAKRFLTQPIDAAMSPDGSLWVTDTGKDRIVRYVLPVGGGYGVAAYEAGSPAVFSSNVEPARRVVDARDGARVERDDETGVIIPENALIADLEVTVDKADENKDLDAKRQRRLERGIAPASQEIEYGPSGTTFNAPATLVLAYNPIQISAQGMQENDLKVHYWNPATHDWEALPSTVDKSAKTVSAFTNHFSVYQVMGPGGGISVAGIDAAFGLKDLYAFPNPVRGGKKLTIRIQVGLADSVKINIYDISGKLVHSDNIVNPQIIDDGNGKGAQYTYDYIWDNAGAGSGVYLYAITAKKSGAPPIHKLGKVGVIK